MSRNVMFTNGWGLGRGAVAITGLLLGCSPPESARTTPLQPRQEVTRKGTPTPTAGRAIPGLPSEGGGAAAYSKRCAIGSSSTDSFPRLTTRSRTYARRRGGEAFRRLRDGEWPAASGGRWFRLAARRASRYYYESEWRWKDPGTPGKAAGDDRVGGPQGSLGRWGLAGRKRCPSDLRTDTKVGL